MSASMDNLRNDVRKPPEELAREADSARHAVEGTLSELEQRLSPGQMLDRVMDAVKSHGGEFGENLLTQVRNNPLPTILAGIGVAWLMAASKRPPRSGGSYEWSADDMSSAYDSARDKTSSAFDSARDTASSAYNSTKSAAKGALDSTRAAASSATDAAGQAAQRVADVTKRTADTVAQASRAGAESIADLYREQPLVLGAIAIVAGAALGAMLPSTESEDRLLGDVADETKARLKSEVDTRTAGLREAAADAVDTVKEKMGTGGSQRREGAQPSGSNRETTSRRQPGSSGGSESQQSKASPRPQSDGTTQKQPSGKRGSGPAKGSVT